MYVLILTVLSVNSHSRPAMTNVTGFTSLNACMEAGRLYIKNTQARVSAVCVKL